MRIFENINSRVSLSTAIVLIALLGSVAASRVNATEMTVSPTNPAANINATTTVDVRFNGKVLTMTRNYVVCAPNNCTMLFNAVKLYEGNVLISPNFVGPVICTSYGLFVINGVNYDSCENAALKVTIPAKTKAGKYTYTVKHESDTFANSTSASFVVSVGSGGSVSAILPLLLD